MAEFFTRVELHDEQKGDYDKLHAQMAIRGFARTVTVNGIECHLPDATYVISGVGTAQGVNELALEAVNAIGRAAGIVVAQTTYAQVSVTGLIPVK
ncbi:hypothetical protein [Burkholderia sp. BCC0097]|uniref:hypothetical protein n=1 Tax=Burkholderia sp. BCC0097 TaxID=2676289 RepID=UPI00158F4E52|nr:hypothetical protein [Burkholderia sp. BCC0097]